MKETESKLVDSSVWLAYLFNGEHKDVIDSNGILLLSVLSLFEVKKKLAKSAIEKSKISRSMGFIKKRSLVSPVSSEIAEGAADFSLEHELSIIDSLIYATSIFNGSILLTRDNDFRGLGNVIVFK